jgi:glutathione synthase/RimK-type ligase-like ATP-grasp enzyme
MAFSGIDLSPLRRELTERVRRHPDDAAALMDLSTVVLLAGDREHGLDLQTQALRLEQRYRQPAARHSLGGVRLLAFVAPGDFMANTPVDLMLEDSDVTLDLLYVVPDQPLARAIPDHDVAFVAVGESEDNVKVLRWLARLVDSWPRPVLNAPDGIARLSREGTWVLLRSAPGVAVPMVTRIDRETLDALGRRRLAIEHLLEDGGFPIICRPAGSHAGHGLARLEDPPAIDAYLEAQPEREFLIARFVDYRGPDGLFRKYRIVFIDGRPFAGHMAISRHWMVHYLNADMHDNAANRAEEARFMASFDGDFARRHETALHAIAERVGLDYFGIDCGETPDGRLLVFEADVAIIIHDMDPPDVYPYKGPQMRKVFAAFRAMLGRASRSRVP